MGEATPGIYIALACGIGALLYAVYLVMNVLRQGKGPETVQNIGRAIQEGAIAFLNREYRILAIVVVIIAVALAILSTSVDELDKRLPISYVVGAICSGVAGLAGMHMAIRANMRTTTAAQQALNPALRVAFSSGAVMGITVVGVGLLGLLILWLAMKDPDAILGYSFGASTVALFARVGGGIFTKGADVGADLVGKVEAGIPEDDPRNPAVIADNVGDNVGDVAGMGADLFESYVGSIIATMALAATALAASEYNAAGFVLPILVAGGGIVASILGTFFVRTREQAEMGALLFALRRGIFVSSVLTIIFSALIVWWLNDKIEGQGFEMFWAILAGLVAGVVIGLGTEYFTSYVYRPTQSIARSALTGPATTIISGFSVGMLSTALPVAVIALAVFAANEAAGVYGVALAAVGMLSTLGITLATDAYGPVADNAGGIAEQAHLPPEVRQRTDALDSLGNTTAATGKGFAIGSALLTALAFMVAYKQAVKVEVMDLANPDVIVGGLVGAAMPFVFSALTMSAVGGAAQVIVNEVRRQFREIPGLMQGTGRPDYARCVDISTRGALQQMILPGILALVVPIIVGLSMGPEALGGVLIGSITAGFLIAVTMANSGGAWDNAKKLIESGHHGGKGSDPHKAAVVGDTVGDPFKDTSGPSINILIKLMSIVALVLAPIF
jgi:K(+)-stimulated pyrophosphate-energized sodium pump